VSGFSAEWLRLREDADHRARDSGLVQRLAAYLAGRDKIVLLDLGCGTGSNLRALAPALPACQHWRLVDHDPALLKAARAQIARWEGKARQPRLTFDLEQADLRTELERLLQADCNVVTAAALFDLVSTGWMDAFVARIAEHRCAFYTVLIYDGEMCWAPHHPADEAIREAFNAHQRRDKGFGPAAGPEAAPYLEAKLKAEGYRVMMAQSPWRLTREDLPLMTTAAEGIAEAAAETGRLSPARIASWLSTRQDLQSCKIGHTDLLALPE
jgi:SAM-dependent methyltransferase